MRPWPFALTQGLRANTVRPYRTDANWFVGSGVPDAPQGKHYIPAVGADSISARSKADVEFFTIRGEKHVVR